jgi:L-lactate dehydrogenase complex protein LldF
MIRIKPGATKALRDSSLQRNLRHTLVHSLQSRDLAIGDADDWEELRRYARDTKLHTLGRLHDYLVQLEDRVTQNGGQVVWAETAAEAVNFLIDLARREGVRRVVKSKTMLGEEIHVNEGLEAAGLEVVETDLGEYIVQLRGEAPSHIVTPASHLSKEQVAELFTDRLRMEPTDDVEELTATARRVLRRKFIEAELGISGVNFAVAETGTVVVVENEGNARLSTSIPRIHVALMGIEKVLPRAEDLPVFLKLLIRSATGQKITSYVNLISGPRRAGEVDGPDQFYLVIVDNGRSRMLDDPLLRQTLYCIRCGACLNVCPVFQRIGGHAYGSVYQGPIGAILTPQLLSAREAADHPFASSLCGACHEVCPVKIEIPEILLRLRARVKAEASGNRIERLVMAIWAWFMRSSSRYEVAARWLRRLYPVLVRGGRMRPPIPPLSLWQKERDLPVMPRRSFRELWEEESRRK